MSRRAKLIGVAAASMLLAGCGLIGIIQPSTVTVRLINNGSFPVDVELYIADNQDIPRALLTSIGTRMDHTVAPGDVVTFTRDCDDLQAIIIDDADLRVVGGIGPSASTGVLRDGTDFRCGDTIAFTFTHSAVLVDFNISVNVLR